MPTRAFWVDFVENHWQRKPGIFKNLMPTPMATAEEMFRAMKASFKRPQIEATSVYVDGRHLTAAEVGAFAPSEADRDVNAYLARCAPEQEICMVIDKLQELFPGRLAASP